MSVRMLLVLLADGAGWVDFVKPTLIEAYLLPSWRQRIAEIYLSKQDALLLLRSFASASVLCVSILVLFCFDPSLFWIPFLIGSVAVAGSNYIHLRRAGIL